MPFRDMAAGDRPRRFVEPHQPRIPPMAQPRPQPAKTTARPSAEQGRAPSFLQSLIGVNAGTLLFLAALLLPVYTSFQVGPLRLTVYRLILLFAVLPCALMLVSSKKYRLQIADVLICFMGLWVILALMNHHGANIGLESGGIIALEGVGAYLLARVLVHDAKTFRGFAAAMTLIVMILLLATLPEALTGNNLFGQPRADINQRMGITRARGPFEHPIIYGVFCASVTALSWYAFSGPNSGIKIGKLFRGGVIAAAAFMCVSSGAIVSVMFQFMLIGWEQFTRMIKRRWWLFLGLWVLAYIAVDLLSNRGPMRVFLTYFTFSAHTAYNRLIIWEWGFHENALKNPLFGIGMAEWVRPSWMVSTSMDNFWLVLMVRYGIPCFLFVATAMVLLVYRAQRGSSVNGNIHLFYAWTISVAGASVAAATVHFWNALFVYFFFLLGAGAWLGHDASAAKGKRT